MKIPPFGLERFFARYEFTAPYLMCSSDCESMTIRSLLGLCEASDDALMDLWLGYTESQGAPDLRQAISGLYANISPDQVLVHAGAEEAIFNFVNAVLSPGDHVIIQFPAYESLYQVAQAAGCRVSMWEGRPHGNRWKYDLNELSSLITPGTRALVINTPHNPTGFMFSPEEMGEIVGLARKNNLILFVDEVYRYLEYDPRQRSPWGADLYENAVSLGVMSKSFGLPGLRIGWIATRNADIYRAMAFFKDYTTICNSGPSEVLATIALQHFDRLADRNLSIIQENIRLADEFFARYPELFVWLRPLAGPIGFPRLTKPGLNAGELCQQLVEETGVLIAPGQCFNYDINHFRIGLGRKNFPDCLNRFEDFVRRNLV